MAPVDPIAGARAVLPVLVPWGGIASYTLLALGASFAVTRLLTGFALAPLRAANQAHWSERARLAHGPRLVLLASIVALPVEWAVASIIGLGPLVHGGNSLGTVAVYLSAAGGVALAALVVQREILARPVSAAEFMRAIGASLLVRLLHVILLAAVGLALPAPMPGRAIAVAAAGLAACVLAFLGLGLVLARACGLAAPASPRLASVVARAAHRVGRTPRAVYEVEALGANAMAFPLGQRLAVTRPALALLDDDELFAVCAHEIGHLAEPTSWLMARGVVLVLLVVPLFEIADLVRRFGPWTVLLLSAWTLVIVRLFRRFARRAEIRADALAHGTEVEPGIYARALEKIYAANVVPAVARPGRGSHPPLWDRMIAAGVTPTFAKPAPPTLHRARIALLALLPAIVIFGFWPLVAGQVVARHLGRSAFALELSIAAFGGDSRELGALAHQRLVAHDLGAADALFNAAAALQPHRAYYPAMRAMVIATAGRCDDAKELYDRAASERRAGDDRALDTAWQAVMRCYGRSDAPY